jgi:hypothetical protein
MRKEISDSDIAKLSAWTHYVDGGSGESALTAQTAMVMAT